MDIFPCEDCCDNYNATFERCTGPCPDLIEWDSYQEEE